jgi:hypothetical protein
MLVSIVDKVLSWVKGQIFCLIFYFFSTVVEATLEGKTITGWEGYYFGGRQLAFRCFSWIGLDMPIYKVEVSFFNGLVNGSFE